MNKKLKVLAIATAAIFILLILAGIYIVATRDKKQPNQKSNQPTAQETQKSADEKGQKPTTQTPSTSGSQTNNGGTATQKPDDKKKPWFSVKLISVTQAGHQLAIRAEVRGTAKGSCELELTKAGLPSLKRKVNIGLDTDRDADKLNAKTICLGFIIPTEQIYVSGIWTLKLVAKVDDVTSEPVEKKVEINR